MEFKDYYAALGVDKTASAADIKRAYRKLARESHPDLHPGDTKAEARFKAINEAHEVLGDPETRKKYDDLGAHWKDYERTAATGGAPGAAWPGGGGGGVDGRYRTMTPEEAAEAFGSADPFSDFFHTFFGGSFEPAAGRGRRTSRHTRGQDFEQVVDLSLEEVLTGTSRKVRSTRRGQERTVEVRIPAGVQDGARVRAAGEGGGSAHGPSGDLYLTVRLLPHPTFERRGRDLHTRVEIPLLTAVLGGEVSVPTLSGSSLRLRVPELTPPTRTFRLRGHGLPALGRAEDRGDLLVTAQIQMPTELGGEARRHYEALRALGADGARTDSKERNDV
jgi:curved DNA-binding protein